MAYLDLTPPKKDLFKVKVTGTAPLLLNKVGKSFFEKQEVKVDTPKKSGKVVKEIINPNVEFWERLFHMTDEQENDPDMKHKEGFQYYLPAAYFKGAMIGTATESKKKKGQFDGTMVKKQMFVRGNPDVFKCVLTCSPPQMHTAPVRVNGKSLIVRHRPIIEQWECEFEIVTLHNTFSAQQIYDLVYMSGSMCGVGDRRPGIGGTYGTFEAMLY